MQLSVVVCNDEVLALAVPGVEQMAYTVGDTATISNIGALFTSFFSVSPTNAVAPYCNTIEWEAYTD